MVGAEAVIATGLCLFVIGFVMSVCADAMIERGLIRKGSWFGAASALCTFAGIGLVTAGIAVMAWRVLP